jgi:hypothetical protein
MKILAIEKDVPGVDWASVSKELLAEEARAVYRLYQKGLLREHYFNEKRCAVLVLECKGKSEAASMLDHLPLVAQHLIEFELMELQPYTGYTRIMDAAMEG